MPLRLISRPDAPGLYIVGTVTPAGAEKGIRIRRRAGSDDAALAQEECITLEAALLRGHYLGERPADVGFAAAVVSYLQHAERSPGTRALIQRVLQHFRETPLAAIDQAAIDRARTAVLRPGAAPATVRRNLIAPVSAVLTHAAKRGWCGIPSFDAPPIPRSRIRFLLPAQAEALIAAAAPHLAPLLRVGFCTGCRAGELVGLDWQDVDLAGARALLWEGETKGDDRRVVALPPAAVAALAALPHRAGPVFRTAYRKSIVKPGKVIPGEGYRAAGSGEGGGHFKTAWKAACRRAGIEGVTPHAMRHSWASWHYARHRDPLLLQQDGGWSGLALVARYAHLIPAGQEAAIAAFWGLAPEARRPAKRKTGT